jgi:cell division protein FtsB
MKWSRVTYVILFLLLAGFAVLRGPRGLMDLRVKHQEIGTLQQQVSDLERQNDEKRKAIQALKTSAAERELEVRKQLKYQKPGEMQFVLPDAKPAPSEKK